MRWLRAWVRGFVAWNRNLILQNLANEQLSNRFQNIAIKCELPCDDAETAYDASEDIASGVASERVFALLRCFKRRCRRHCELKEEVEQLERDLKLRLECGDMRAA